MIFDTVTSLSTVTKQNIPVAEGPKTIKIIVGKSVETFCCIIFN